MLEININIGRLIALGRDETFKQQIKTARVHRGNADAITHGRVGGTAAPLTQNALGARKAHQVVHGEEIGRVIQILDKRQFMAYQPV